MATDFSTRKTFSRGRKWAAGFNALVAVAAVLAIGGMLNYIATEHFTRLELGASRQARISPQTDRVLRSITNRVDVTVFFDAQGQEELFNLTTTLLREYNYINPLIVCKAVDPVRDPATAELILNRYKLTGLKNKNFIVIDCEGRTKVIYESELSEYDINSVLAGQSKEFRRKAFKGEMLFTTAIFNLANPRQFSVYFLTGHGEHDPNQVENPHGYSKFATILQEKNNVQWQKLSLLGTNDVPADCQLLVIAGPRLPFTDDELDKIGRYLKQGGRLFALMGNMAYSESQRTGLEKLLAQWGIGVADDMVFDPKNSPTGNDLLAAKLNPTHPITKALFSEDEDMRLRLVLPRAVGKSSTAPTGPDAPRVDVLASTSDGGIEASELRNGAPYRNPYTDQQASFPLMAAVEQGNVQNITSERGDARIVVVGDSLCLDNELIDTTPANHYFAALAVDWLLDRPQVLLAGLLPRPLKEYRVVMSQQKLQIIEAIFLAGMPGAVLLVGGFVWWRRRK